MENRYRWRILLVAMAGYGLVQMGLVPVSSIMPTLSEDLGVPLQFASWLLTGYLLAMTALVLAAGRLGDRYGHRLILVIGLGILTVSLAASGLNHTFGSFLAVRVVQGMASALINGTALAWVSNAFPVSHRGRVVGAVTLSAFVGAFVSLYWASWVIQHASWHWLFLAMVPLGGLALAAGLSIPNERPCHGAEYHPMDWAGVVLLALTLITFSLGLTHAHGGAGAGIDDTAWHLGMQLLAGLFAALLVWIERRARDPIIPLHWLRNKPLMLALGANLILHMVMLSSSSILPFLVQVGMGLTVHHTAILLMMLQILSLIVSPLSGWLYDVADTRVLLPGSIAIVGSGLFVYGLFHTALSFPALIGLGIYLGTGMGLFLTANNAVIMSTVPSQSRGFASGMLETTRQLGHGVGATVIGSILSTGIVIANAGGSNATLLDGFRLSYWLMALLAGFGIIFSSLSVRAGRRQAAAAANG